MRERPAVLALDQGSHASRACLFDERGALIAAASVPVAVQRIDNEHVEQDPWELHASVVTAIERCLAQAPTVDIAAAGMATQRSSIVCASRLDNTPLSPVLSWQDRRNAAWLESLRAHETRIWELTGLPLSPHYGASKMRWCCERLPAVHAAADADTLRLNPLAAWLQAALTGETPLADPANASRTLLWDAAQLDWSTELLPLFAIERSWLPDCAFTCQSFGMLTVSGRSVPLTACTGDQSAVPYAFGTADPDSVYINLGTGAFIQRPLRDRPAAPAPLLGSVLRAASSATLYSLEGTVNGAGGAVQDFVQTRGLQEDALWQALERLDDHEALPLFVNVVGGLGSPWWQAQRRSRFVGAGDTLHEFAALVESVVHMIAVNFRLMAQHQGTPQRALVMGGLSRSRWLCRRLATALGISVMRVDSEATARGAAVLAAPDFAARWPAADGEVFEPSEIAGFAARAKSLQEIFDAGEP